MKRFSILFALVFLCAGVSLAEETMTCIEQGYPTSCGALMAITNPPSPAPIQAVVKLGAPGRDAKGYFVPVTEGWANFIPQGTVRLLHDRSASLVDIGHASGSLETAHAAEFGLPLSIRFDGAGKHDYEWQFPIVQGSYVSVQGEVQIPICEVPQAEPLVPTADWNSAILSAQTLSAADSVSFEIGKDRDHLMAVDAADYSKGPYPPDRLVSSTLVVALEPNTDYVFRAIAKSACYTDAVKSSFLSFRTPQRPSCPPQCAGTTQPPATCTDPNATNYGQPLPCRYVQMCIDPRATNYNQPAPCQYLMAPTVVKGDASIVTSYSAVLFGQVNPNGSATTYWIQYWSDQLNYGTTTAVRSIGASFEAWNVQETISTLQPNTTYFYRLVAENKIGTTYGQIQSFTTSQALCLDPAAANYGGPVPCWYPQTVLVNGALDATTPPSRQITMGSTANGLLTFRLRETSNRADVYVYDIPVIDTVSKPGAPVSFRNMSLVCDTGLSVTVLSGSPEQLDSTHYRYLFHSAIPVLISQSATTTFSLLADVGTLSELGSSAENVKHQLSVDASQITYGVPVGMSVSASGVATGNSMTVLKGKLSITIASLGATSDRVRSSVDTVGTISFAATGSDVAVHTVKLTLRGSALQNGASAFDVQLIDLNTGIDWAGGSAVTCTPSIDQCSVLFAYSGPTAPIIASGLSKTVQIRLNSNGFSSNAGTPNVLAVMIQSPGDITWSDGISDGLPLEAFGLPTVFSLLYQ